MKFEPAKMLVSFTATLPRWKFQPAEMHGHSSKAVISTCRNIISDTATLLRLSFQSAEMLVSCTATLPRWKIQPAEILSVTQPHFRGHHFNLPKYWSVAQPLFRSGKKYNLLKYYQLHSHSSEVFLGCNYNLPKYWSIAQPLPLAHHPTAGQLVITWTCPVGHPISPPTPLVVTWTWLLANPLLVLLSCGQLHQLNHC